MLFLSHNVRVSNYFCTISQIGAAQKITLLNYDGLDSKTDYTCNNFVI